RPGGSTMSCITRAILALAVTLTATANAQIVGLTPVWTVLGALNTDDGVGTFIACTNGPTVATVGVEFYDSTGNFLIGNTVTMAPAATVLFGSRAADGLSVDVSLAPGLFFYKGHARILGSTKTIACSAFLANVPFSGAPESMSALKIVKAFAKQKGE